MEEIEVFKEAIEEYEKAAKVILTEDEKKIFRFAYGKGFMDSGKLITDILVK